jgi:hypothetical protein
VVRPGDQINQVVDTRALPTSASFVPGFTATTAPIVPFHRSDFWAQGISFGVGIEF